MFISSDPDICPISSYLLSSKIDGSEPLDDKAEEIFSLDEETVTLVASTEVIGNYRFFLLALSESGRNQSLAINVIFTSPPPELPFEEEPVEEEPVEEPVVEEEVAEEEETEEEKDDKKDEKASAGAAFVFTLPPPAAPAKGATPPVIEVSAEMFTSPNPVLRQVMVQKDGTFVMSFSNDMVFPDNWVQEYDKYLAQQAALTGADPNPPARRRLALSGKNTDLFRLYIKNAVTGEIKAAGKKQPVIKGLEPKSL